MSTKVRKSRQEKMVESVLTKAKRFVTGLEVEEDKSDKSTEDGGPPAKRRKPRHASEEGRRFLEAKAKSGDYPSKTSSPEKSSKKKKKKKGKKKKTVEINKSTSAGGEGGESSDRLRKEALAYLQLWKAHRNVWKFEKLKQLWLLKHAVNESMVGDALFPTLLEYIGSVVGVAKVKTLQGSQSVMSEFEGMYGSSDPKSVLNLAKKNEGSEATEVEKKAYERARQIVQMLS